MYTALDSSRLAQPLLELVLMPVSPRFSQTKRTRKQRALSSILAALDPIAKRRFGHVAYGARSILLLWRWQARLAGLQGALRAQRSQEPTVNELRDALAKEADIAAVHFPAKVTDLAIPQANAPSIPVRHYTPLKPQSQPSVALVYFHGGGYCIGSAATHDSIARTLCVVGNMQVFSIDYRLAPEHSFPAAYLDGLAATLWVSNQRSKFGCNAVVVAGDSAGGGLAAAIALHWPADSEALSAQLLVYPWLDLQRPIEQGPFATEHGLTEARLRWYADHYLAEHPYVADSRHSPRASIPKQVAARVAKTVIISADCDPLAEEAQRYAAALEECQVPATLIRGKGLPHGFLHMTALVPGAYDTFLEAIRLIREAVRVDSE
jgi:acetyl esterase